MKEYPHPEDGARLASLSNEAAEKVLGPKDNLKGLQAEEHAVQERSVRFRQVRVDYRGKD